MPDVKRISAVSRNPLASVLTIAKFWGMHDLSQHMGAGSTPWHACCGSHGRCGECTTSMQGARPHLLCHEWYGTATHVPDASMLIIRPRGHLKFSSWMTLYAAHACSVTPPVAECHLSRCPCVPAFEAAAVVAGVHDMLLQQTLLPSLCKPASIGPHRPCQTILSPTSSTLKTLTHTTWPVHKASSEKFVALR